MSTMLEDRPRIATRLDPDQHGARPGTRVNVVVVGVHRLLADSLLALVASLPGLEAVGREATLDSVGLPHESGLRHIVLLICDDGDELGAVVRFHSRRPETPVLALAQSWTSE